MWVHLTESEASIQTGGVRGAPLPISDEAALRAALSAVKTEYTESIWRVAPPDLPLSTLLRVAEIGAVTGDGEVLFRYAALAIAE